jgi:hypothetical protein
MSGRYKIYSELNFGIAKMDPGVKSFEELYELAKRVREDINFPKVYFNLTDLRGCTFNFDVSKLAKIGSLIEEYQNDDNQNTGVYLIDEPIATAYAHLFFDSLKYKRELCSTVGKAYRLLNLPVSYAEFITLINI